MACTCYFLILLYLLVSCIFTVQPVSTAFNICLFSWDSPIFMGFKELCLGVLQNYVRTPNVLGFSQVKSSISGSGCFNMFDFPQLAKSISGLMIIKIGGGNQ